MLSDDSFYKSISDVWFFFHVREPTRRVAETCMYEKLGLLFIRRAVIFPTDRCSSHSIICIRANPISPLICFPSQPVSARIVKQACNSRRRPFSSEEARNVRHSPCAWHDVKHLSLVYTRALCNEAISLRQDERLTCWQMSDLNWLAILICVAIYGATYMM